MRQHSSEISYLKNLIGDFPSRYKPNEVSKAYNDIAARFQSLEQNIELFVDFKNKEDSIANVLCGFSYAIHHFLFADILSNAGKVRTTSDPNSGRIHFDGQKHQQYRARFHGTSPPRIEQELEIAFSHLKAEPDDPIEQALRFYQHFVKIHPFYDANGRIGRLIVSIYLYGFDRYVLWSKFDGANNTQFIKKLNNCHKRMQSGHRFEQYFTYLHSFFSNYVITIDELQDFDK